ncbi:hypothetical protein G7K_2196-t1 [Saitoella complicata NRRL Y-17804]|uniref:AAA+ ATPase domain-containing protein n=1 Tax=Saitoella complicata (strain BCRC 22490 / CBS 7301 / JCM 7358 / NBRC 10748 / NRRL Y-17804) TaxID=698492 RepID=A0A0E9NE83_SAICN|nr:hypothetical protein G7K_2196-t1 [Saitoella complicata NRRL Y-17804]
MTKAFTVAISGPSCSGKSTCVRFIRRIFPNTTIVYEDDFYLPDSELPIDSETGYQNWDTAEAINFDKLVDVLRYTKREGRLPEGYTSREDTWETGGSKSVSTEVLDELQQMVQQRLKEKGVEDSRLVFVDGFMLYNEQPVLRELSLKLLLRAPKDILAQRRIDRGPYITAEGEWSDPPGYFELVWKSYVEYHKNLFEGGDVDGELRGEMKEGGMEVSGLDGGNEERLRWVVKRILDRMSGRPRGDAAVAGGSATPLTFNSNPIIITQDQSLGHTAKLLRGPVTAFLCPSTVQMPLRIGSDDDDDESPTSQRTTRSSGRFETLKRKRDDVSPDDNGQREAAGHALRRRVSQPRYVEDDDDFSEQVIDTETEPEVQPRKAPLVLQSAEQQQQEEGLEEDAVGEPEDDEDDIDDVPSPDGPEDPADGEYEEDSEPIGGRRPTRGGKAPRKAIGRRHSVSQDYKSHNHRSRRDRNTSRGRSQQNWGDEESDYKANSGDDDDEALDSDELVEERENNGMNDFVVQDSEDEHRRRSARRRALTRAAQAPPPRATRRSTRQHHRSSSPGTEPDLDDDDDEIRNEARELRGTPSPARKPTLRQRDTRPNYHIPPPTDPIYDADDLLELGPAPRMRGSPKRRTTQGVVQQRRTLYPKIPWTGENFTRLIDEVGQGKGGGDDSSSDSDDEAKGGGMRRPSYAALGQIAPGAKQGHSADHTGGPANLGKITSGKSNLADADPLGVDMNVNFESVGGMEEEIRRLNEMVMLPLMYPEIFQRFGTTPPRGVLFHGPPGTGKTLMARALASSCSTAERPITFYMRKGADCLSKWVGEAERQLRLLFEEARANQPAIIFFDEIDGLAPVRSSKQEQIHASIVSTMLALMDGMDGRGQVIVIGATNRPDAVDPALRRPGRFDREFYFPLPGPKARRSIIDIHTRGWEPPLPDSFKEHMAYMTKGYGGADLRALCTESALIAVQRRFPQIYTSKDKLLLDPAKIEVKPRDFMLAMKKIIPSSERSSSSGAAPLPAHIAPLLEGTLQGINKILEGVLPEMNKASVLDDAMYEQDDDDDDDPTGGFARENMLRRFESARVFRPRLLVHGEKGMGQQYIAAAILHHFEGFHVQSFDLATLLSDSTRSPEAAVVQLFIEVKRHKPSVVYIPNVDVWYDTVSEAVRMTFAGLLRDLKPSDPVLFLGITETPAEHLDPGLKSWFQSTKQSQIQLLPPREDARRAYFQVTIDLIKKSPKELPGGRERRKRVLEVLPKAPPPAPKIMSKKEVKELEIKDRQLKNALKIKLSVLMEQLKGRYKRFKKPTIDDDEITYYESEEQVEAAKTAFPVVHFLQLSDGMIFETSNKKKYFNMDLDTIEQRLWAGYYLTPNHYLNDIETIQLDALTEAREVAGFPISASVATEYRERVMKAQEMYTNAQMWFEEHPMPQHFIDELFRMAEREMKRREETEKQQRKAADDAEKQAAEAARLAAEEAARNAPVLAIHEAQVDDAVVMDGTLPSLQLAKYNFAGQGGVEGDVVIDGAVQPPVQPRTTFDMDAFDRAVFSAQGTPVPGLANDAESEPILSTTTDEPVIVEAGDISVEMADANAPLSSQAFPEAVASQSVDHPNRGEVSVAPESQGQVIVQGEPEPPREPTPEYIYDPNLTDVVSEEFLDITGGMSVEELEQVNSACIGVIWRMRTHWDRVDVAKQVTDVLEKVVSEIRAAKDEGNGMTQE